MLLHREAAAVVPATYSFLPNEPGQPAGERAVATDFWSAPYVMEQVEGFMLKQPEVQSMVGVLGFSFSGQGQNAALAFVTLKSWSEHTRACQQRPGRGWPRVWCAGGCAQSFIFPLNATILGWSSGLQLRLQDRGGLGFSGPDGRPQPVAGRLASKARC